MHSLKQIPDDFDWKIYLEKNIDLPRNYNEQDCINHYLTYGQYEKRVYREKKNFSLLVYSNRPFINCDLFSNLLQCIKYNNFQSFILHNIMDNHLKINMIIKNYSDQYKQLNKKNYVSFDESITSISPTHNSTLFVNEINYSSFEYNNQIEYKDFMTNISNIYYSFILILDLPESYIGGTRAFINNIIYKYSKNNALIFIRPTKNNLYNIYVNNTKTVNLNITEIINFIDLNKLKINKIFFNHCIDFSKDLLNYILTLGIPSEKTLVTHDHFYLTGSSPQNTMDQVYNFISDKENKENTKNNIGNYLLNSVDNIISQNINNIYMIGDNNQNLNKLIISELPDFGMRDKKIVTNNKSINILFIGDIQDLKGCELINFLSNDYYKDTNIKTFLIGSLSAYEINNSSRYKNIDEFNNLLINYKPNLIVETSVWPETYSFTLTLSMLTELPIISLRKPFTSVVESRLKNYSNTCFFSTLKEINNLIHEKKQNFFYTIKPIIFFNNFWDNYFNQQHDSFNSISKEFDDFSIIKSTFKKNLVLITSKIVVSNKVFNYVNTRSVYTYKERLDQTINTIEGVRKNIPNCFIVLIDNSNFINLEDKQNLNKIVDYFINPPENNEFLNYYTNYCKYKCLGELSQIIYSYYYFFKHIDFTKINYFFKISGRYFINEKFNFNIFNNDKIIFKHNKNVTDRRYFYTSFYKLTNNFLPTYFSELLDVYSNRDKYYEKDLEVIFSEKFIKHITLVDELGITQNFACWNISDSI